MYECIHCRQAVELTFAPGDGGSRWIHADGYFDCRPTYAAPNFERPLGRMKGADDRDALM